MKVQVTPRFPTALQYEHPVRVLRVKGEEALGGLWSPILTVMTVEDDDFGLVIIKGGGEGCEVLF